MASGGFAAGLAQGLQNGVELYGAYQEGRQRKKDRETDAAIADAMKAKGLDPETSSPMMLAAGPQTSGAETMPVQVQEPTMAQPSATQPPEQAQAYPVRMSEPTMEQSAGVPQDASGQAAGLQAPAVPGLALAVQQDQQADTLGLGKKKDNPAPQGFLSGGEFGDMAESLTRGIRKALELGAPGKAMELLVAREKTIGQYRDQAFGEAMSRFDLTGDPNAFVPFVNRFAPTGIELRSIEKRPETAGGQPVYIAHGINHETGQPVQQPFSQQTLTQFLSTIGDGRGYRTMFAEQAKHWYDMQAFKEKERFKTDEGIRKAGAEHGMTLSEIGARGAEQRKTDAAKGSVDNKTAAPSEVRTAKWLIENGVAKDASSAWDMVRGARTKSRQEFALDAAKSILSSQRNDFGGDKLTPKQALQQGLELYDSMNEGAAADTTGPTVGAVEDGYRFKGGDPSDASNWEKM